MAIQNSDLLVVQTVPAEGEASKLYKLSVGDLDSFYTSDGDGTVRTVQTTLPLQDDGDTVNPTISIREATSTLNGSVHRLATSTDVATTNNAPSERAVVTANLLHNTNGSIDSLFLEINSVASDLTALTLEVDGVIVDLANLSQTVDDLSNQIGDFDGNIDGGIYAA